MTVALKGDCAVIDRAYVQRMARYNRWQNVNLFGAADRLSDEERRRERSAFFGSIHKTLSHLVWADHIQMSRFTDVPRPRAGIPESVSLYNDWNGLKEERARFDDAAGRRAFQEVFERLISRIPGKPWATTPELLERYGFASP